MRPRLLLHLAALVLATSAVLQGCDASSSSDDSPTPAAETRTFGIPWNAGVAFSSLVDGRDGRVYRTVTIGAQTWMAQNLSFRRPSGSSDSVGTCYYKNADSCGKYGALYTWFEAMDGETSSASLPSGVRGICPEGWHLPSDTEWTVLGEALGARSAAALKSTAGWNEGRNGSDSLGFRALPGGYLYSGSMYRDNGRSGTWWTATSLSSMDAYDRTLSIELDELAAQNTFQGNSVSVRCLRDGTAR